ncbi:MAG: amino acid adenylation domain-containing protein [Nitrospira sp.]|nr:amino acid adenylation domain-containing protein [Nitrospira sp.]
MSKKKDIESIHYLSPLQEGLLFHAVSDADADPYFTQTGFIIDGELDIKPFEQAWQKVVERHPILRTGFVWDGLKKPMQVARRGVRVPLQLLDWRAHHSRRRDEALAMFLREDRRKPFDLLTPPMMRLTLIQMENNRWYFINSHHHILLDGWSVALLLREVLNCYDALAHGRQPVLPPVRPYAEYLTWLRSRNLESAEIFWRNGLAEFSTPTALPLEMPQRVASDELKSLPYAEQEVRLSKAEVETLTAAAKRRRLTLNTLAQGAWSILLHRCTGAREVLFGATVSGRPAELPGSDVMVGLFINTLPVRVTLPPDVKLEDWLASLQEQNSLLRQYEWTPLSRIQRWSDTPGGRPLFDSIIVFESYPEDGSDRDQLGLRITPLASHRQDAEYVLTAGRNNYPLSLMVEPAAELRLILSYARERFAHGDIARLLGYYRTLLMAMAERPEVRLGELSPLNEAERGRLLMDWNRTMVPVKSERIHERIARVAHERSDAVAVVYEGQSLTYGELDARANRLAQYLQKLGIGPDMRVGLCVERSLDLIVGLLGVLKAGGAYVALDPKLPKERLAFMLSDSGARVVLTQAASGDLSSDSMLRQVYLDRDWPEIVAGTDEPLRRHVRPENLAYVIYTSGSTGRPKGVTVEHRQVVNYVSGLLSRLSLDEATSFATLSTVAADLGNTSIFGALCSGRTLHMLSVDRGFDPDAVADYMAGHRIDVLKIVPSHLTGLLEAGRPEHVLPRRCLILGGEAVHSSLVERIRTLAPDLEIINHYGPTETTVGVLTHRIDAEPDRHAAIPIGRPLANSQVFILNPDGQPTPVGVSGELYVGGDGLARGYLARPDLTAERFVPNPFSGRGGRLYRTGDRARYRPDGTVEFHGRLDNQVKVRGFRIELGEIETQLRGDGRLKDAVVIVREAADGTKQLAAYVAGPADLDLDSVRSHLAVHLPDYMIPSTLTVLDALPLTANGKIDRAALPDPEQAQTPQRDAYAAPRNDVETTLAQIWADVLHVDRVGIHDNFFAIGGDSILCLQIVAKAHRAGIKLTPKLVFQHHTIAALVASLDEQVPLTGAEEPRPDTASIEPFALARVDKSQLDSILARFGADVEDVYPSSPMQQGMLLHSFQGDKTGVYHNQLTYTFSADFDDRAFTQAWQRMIEDHAILRTGFLWNVAPEPLQIVFRSIPVPIERRDWRGLSDERERETALREYLAQDRIRGFDVAKPPLMRLCIIRMREQLWCIVWSLHHAILDGWCQALLLKEVLETYYLLRSGQVPRKHSTSSYRNYIQWLLRQDMTAAEAFWRQFLHSFHTPTRLIYSTKPVRPLDRRYGEHRVEFSQGRTAGIHRLAQSLHVTVNTVIQGAWAILLSRYSGEQDVLFGITVSGRPPDLPGGQAIIGLFINTLPLRVQVAPEANLENWLRDIQATNVELRGYEYSPLLRVQGWSGIKRGVPLFDSVLVFQNYVIDDAIEKHSQELGIDLLDGEEGWTDFPLTVTVVPDQQLSLIFSYDRQCIDDRSVECIAEHWGLLLDSMVANSASRLTELSIVSTGDQQRLLVDWNATERSYPSRCLHEIFESQVEHTPDAIAVISEEIALTYRELNTRANQLARVLREEGVGSDVLIALCLERSHDLLVAMLGILKAGGAYVPLDPTYPKERLKYMLRDSMAPIALTHRKLLEGMKLDGVQLIDMDDWGRMVGQSDQNLPVTQSPDHLAYVIYTSGSTGKPKGVMVRHCSVVNFLLSMIEALRPCNDEVVAATTSVSFDIAVLELFLPLVIGAKTVIVSRDVVVEGPRLVAELERVGATFMQATPSGWRLLLSAKRLPKLKVLCGGEVFPRELAREFLANQLNPYNLYGPTETTVWSMIASVTHADDTVPIGLPIGNTQVYLLDASFCLVPIGVPGEVYIGGDGLARGYWQRPELTAERFIPNPFSRQPGGRLYRTGDQARYRPDGTVEFLGRVDHQVKIRGYRIELGEIEARMMQHPHVREAVVVVREDRPGDKRLIAYIVSESPACDAAAIRSFTAETLPDYMVPSVVMFLDTLPLTPNGKVDRKALPVPDDDQLSPRDGAPGTATEEILAGIWAEILGLKHLGVHDNFFELGGHSLLATQVVSRVRSVFHIELPLRALFDHPTVEEFAAAVDRSVAAEGGRQLPPLVLTPRIESMPLSFAQQRLWFLWQLAPDSPMYNVPVALRITGSLDEAALANSFYQLACRHEVVRTTFPMSGGQPIQVIAPEPIHSMSVSDLRDVSTDEREAIVQSLTREEALKLFDLSSGPLLRVHLLRIDDQEQVLLVTMHHIISDAWSMTVLIDEITKLYAASVTGQACSLSPLSAQYADYAVWQRTWLAGDVLDRQLAYWKQQLKDVPVIALPTDRPRPTVQTYRGAIHSMSISNGVVDRLRTLGRRRGATLFMTLLTVLKVLLRYETGQRDIVVGTDVTNRNLLEVENLIGFFVNQIVLRVAVDSTLSFQELLDRVRDVTLAGHAHQDVPFEMLVASLKVKRELQYSPLFQIKLILQQAPPPADEPPGLSLSVMDNEKTTAELDMLLNFEESADGLSGWVEYNIDLFDAGSIARLARYFSVIVEQVATNPHVTVEELERMLAEHDNLQRTRFRQEHHQATSRNLKSIRRRAMSPPPINLSSMRTDR